jgi:hypothetical protein
MGRFKRPPRQEGGNYLSKEEKELLGDEGAITPVIQVVYEEEGGYNGKDRFVLTTEIEGEQKDASFGTNQRGSSRDDVLAAMVEQEITAEDELFVLWEKIEGKGAQAAFINLIPVDSDGNEIEPEEAEAEEPPAPVKAKPAVKKTAAVKKTTARAKK